MRTRQLLGLSIIAIAAIALLAFTLPSASAQTGNAPNPGSIPAVANATANGDCTPHPPIIIDEGFGLTPGGGLVGYELDGTSNSVTGGELYRPGSGVVAGDGTEENPFIIEEWCIAGNGQNTAGIQIRDSSAHVIIRDNLIVDHRVGVTIRDSENVVLANNTVSRMGGSTDGRMESTNYGGNGVVVEDSSGITVQNNTIHHLHGGSGLLVMASDQVEVIGNTIYGENAENWSMTGGIRLLDSSHSRIEDNDLETTGGAGIYLSESHDNVLRDNSITRNFGFYATGDGIKLTGADDNLIESNTVSQNSGAGVEIRLDSDGNQVTGNVLSGETAEDQQSGQTVGVSIIGHYSPDDRPSSNTIEDNVVTESRRYGVHVRSTDDTVIRQNTVTDNGVIDANFGGIRIDGGTNLLVEDNLVAGNGGPGVMAKSYFDDVPSDTTLEGNDVYDNDGPGLELRAHDGPLAATGNWWGHATGPSGGIQDACTDTLADGSGQGIQVDQTSVCFDPWLTQPNGAGAK